MYHETELMYHAEMSAELLKHAAVCVCGKINYQYPATLRMIFTKTVTYDEIHYIHFNKKLIVSMNLLQKGTITKAVLFL